MGSGEITFFAILSFVFSSFAYVPYIRGVLASTTKPTLSTWISWGLMDLAILGGMIQSGTIAWQMVSYVIGVGLVIAVCLYKGAVLGWHKLDTQCVSIVAAAVVLWLATGSPEVAIVLGLVAAVFGSIPMITNLINGHGKESLPAWSLVFAGGICGVLAIPSYTIASALTPVVFVIIQGVVIGLILTRQRG